VAGLGDAFAITEHEGSQSSIQVDLTPTGARCFFGMPMSELAGRVVALSDLLPADCRRLAERLDESPDWGSRLDLVERLVARCTLGTRVDTSRVDWAVARIEAAGGALDVGSLAPELGYSRKHLITLFHDQVGIRPKLLARVECGRREPGERTEALANLAVEKCARGLSPPSEWVFPCADSREADGRGLRSNPYGDTRPSP
jgi:hypothetical protein